MTKWNLIVHVGRCLNCQNCVIADRDEYVGNDFPGYSAPASAEAPSPFRILRRDRGAAPMVDATYLPVTCNHCDDAPCVRAGRGAVRKRDDGIVIIDPVAAKGRRDLVAACPYGAIVWNEERELPQTWIFDAHLLDRGGSLRCAQACPTDVFEPVRLDDDAMRTRAERDGLRTLRPELGTHPRVWYAGLDRWETDFVGLSVATVSSDGIDCVADAEVSLIEADTVVASARTDAFGEVKFDGLTADGRRLEVVIAHRGATARHGFAFTESLFLGEIRIGSVACDAEG